MTLKTQCKVWENHKHNYGDELQERARNQKKERTKANRRYWHIKQATG